VIVSGKNGLSTLEILVCEGDQCLVMVSIKKRPPVSESAGKVTG
jgi:hypothetical protein